MGRLYTVALCGTRFRYLSIVFSGRLLLFAMGTPRRFTIERLLTFLLGPMGCMCAIGEMYHEDLFRLPVIEEEGSQPAVSVFFKGNTERLLLKISVYEPILWILEGWQRARIARLSNLHNCTQNRSPPIHLILGLPLFSVKIGMMAEIATGSGDEDTYDVVRSCQPLFDQIAKLEEGLYNIQFEQHWLQAENDRQVVVNKKIGKQAVYKALIESTALTGASILQAVRFTSEATIIGISTSRKWVDFIFDDILDKPLHIMEALETGKELTGQEKEQANHSKLKTQMKLENSLQSQSTETKLQLKEAIDAGKKTPG
ncbi:transmembrane emp24 domain-containing protein p24beta2-like protein [Tanacetum coccineum]